MTKKRWIWSVIGVLSALLVFWITATLFLSPAYADALPFSMKVRSSLLADYNPDDGKSLFTALRLSILGDTLRDQDLSPEEAEKQRLALEGSLDDPVPTATALNFDGDAPNTPTPTKTPIPTETELPTATSTNRPQATRTPVKTSTIKVVGTSMPVDSKNPVIADPGAITPTPGSFASCSLTLSVANANITDAAPSSGIKTVKLKYKVYDGDDNYYAGYFFSPLSLCSGGPTAGGGWDACYTGGITISVSPGLAGPTNYSGLNPFKLQVWLIAEDHAGKQATHHYGDYLMPPTCDDPSVTSTPTSTATGTATSTSTSTSTTTPTATASATRTP